MKMNRAQYEIVKFFLTELKIDPKKLVRKWNAYWERTGSQTRIDLEQVYRVMLTVSYDIYKQDEIPGEDVMLAMEGL